MILKCWHCDEEVVVPEEFELGGGPFPCDSCLNILYCHYEETYDDQSGEECQYFWLDGAE